MSVKTLQWEIEKPTSFARDAAIVLLSSIFIGLLGQVSIPLPFTPVPIVTQAQAILMLGLLLGSRRAAAATFAFLAQGAMGLPVFAGGAAGLAKLFGPTGGYLVGYLVAAFLVGAISERWKERSLAKACLALVAGNSVIYILGAGYLSTLLGVQKAILLGVAPFLIGDALKIVLCLKILQWIGWERK
jgi:biotin transport system substrate-specific component